MATVSSPAGSSLSSAAAHDDSFEDTCSICLEPFSTDDLTTVTSCKHKYHLQCILEWSQTSKKCPICWQQFVLKDIAWQELLAAIESERLSKSRHIACAALVTFPEDFDNGLVIRVFFKQSPFDSPRRSSPSEVFSFSESVKSKWSAASARYKKLISKDTCSLKQRLLFRNTTVKQLSKEVQCDECRNWWCCKND